MTLCEYNDLVQLMTVRDAIERALKQQGFPDSNAVIVLDQPDMRTAVLAEMPDGREICVSISIRKAAA